MLLVVGLQRVHVVLHVQQAARLAPVDDLVQAVLLAPVHVVERLLYEANDDAITVRHCSGLGGYRRGWCARRVGKG